MTAPDERTPQSEINLPRTRRALLGGLVGGLGAWVAAALSKAPPVRAGVDGDVVLGTTNTAASPTTISNATSSAMVFEAISSYSGGGRALNVLSNGGNTITAENIGISNGMVLVAYNSAADKPVIKARSNNEGAGVFGMSSNDGAHADPAFPINTGIYGYAVTDAASRGVFGQSTTGRGVTGQATTGYGVRAAVTTGTAVYASTSGPKSGTAVRATGKVQLDNSAGIATVLAGTNNVVVTPNLNLTATTAIVATLLGSAGGTTSVRYIAVDTAADTFRIFLTANASANVKVAWHAFN